MTDLEINEAFGKPMYEADPTNARYNSLQLQCYEQRKEINRLNEHVTELENRLRALWDKLEGERKHYMEQIRRLEEAGDELRECALRIGTVASGEGSVIRRTQEAIQSWDKEAKP